MNTLRQLEQDVLAEGREWTRQHLEKRLQDQSDAMPAVCPKTGEGLQDVRWRDRQLMSIPGVVNLRVRHGYSPALGQWVCPVRQTWGLPPYQRLGPELESRLAYTARETTSYEAAAQMATRWGCPAGTSGRQRQRTGDADREICGGHAAGNLASGFRSGCPKRGQASRGGRAKCVYRVRDGAIGLWDLAEDRFAQAIKTLDFHHARDHLWALANSLHGEDMPEAGAWVEPLLRSLRKGRENQVVHHLEELLENQSQRTPEQQELIEREVKFFVKHRDPLHYHAMEKAGAPRGSGAVESLGKQLQHRLRGCGQIGGRPGFTRLLKVVVLLKNQDDHLFWN